MNNLTEIIEGVEKFAYEIMIWALLIPKTLVRIILNPSWVPGYITRELKDKTDDRFDSYISPVVLILISTLFPIAFVISARFPGAVISGPAEAHVHQPMRFVVDATFVEKTKTYHYEWTADELESQVFDHGQLADYVVFTWDTPGAKTVQATVDNGNGESYTSRFNVQIFAENVPLTASIDDNFYGKGRSDGREFMKSLQEPSGLIATFLFLSIPLFLALAIDLYCGVPFSRRVFMRSFYIQCYYFSPIILALWSFVLGAIYFLKPTNEAWLILMPMTTVLILILWLFVNETTLVMREKQTNILFALFFTGTAFLVIFTLSYGYYYFTENPEALRDFMWGFYGVAILGLTVTAALRWIVRMLGRLFQPRRK